jgi:hypothetical protein
VTRRIVRASPAFFVDLDRQLGPDRGPHGEPSATDFLVIELPAVVERFATDFETLPEAVEGVAEARMVIGTGRLVRAFAVYGILMSDDSVELIGIEIDTTRDRRRRSPADHRQTTNGPQNRVIRRHSTVRGGTQKCVLSWENVL